METQHRYKLSADVPSNDVEIRIDVQYPSQIPSIIHFAILAPQTMLQPYGSLTLACLLNLLADGLGDELRDEVLEVAGAGLSGHDLGHLLANQPDLESCRSEVNMIYSGHQIFEPTSIAPLPPFIPPGQTICLACCCDTSTGLDSAFLLRRLADHPIYPLASLCIPNKSRSAKNRRLAVSQFIPLMSNAPGMPARSRSS